jgi:hypothetical protein
MAKDGSELGFKALQNNSGLTSVGVIVRHLILYSIVSIREGAEDVCFSEEFRFRRLFSLR